MQPVSGTLSLPCAGCFSPFPHGTCALSVSREYLALPDGPGRFTQNSSCSALLRIPLLIIFLPVRGFHPLRPDFPDRFQFKYFLDIVVLQPQQRRNVTGLGSSAFARHYLRNHNCFLFLRVLRCFSSPRSPHRLMITCLQHAELPHSEISGSKVVCTYPKLIAAYHVLLRLLEPRHPPFALSFFFCDIVVVNLAVNPKYFYIVN